VRRDITEGALNEHQPWSENAVFRCSLCGAYIDLDKKDIMKMCPFCGNPNIIKTDDLPGIKPDSLIPYKVTKESAVDLFKKWIHSKIFAPGECRKYARAENVNSVFSPVWSFAAGTRNKYSGQLGKDYTETYTDSKGNTQTRTKTRWFKVSGVMDADYKDIFVPSGERIPKDMAQKLEPYPIGSAVGYKQEYLAGKAAEHYSRDLNTCFGEFGRYVYADLCQRIRKKYGADHVGKMDIDTTYNTKQFNYVLLPNYIANFTFKKKWYNFYVNGATGKVVGKYPLSAVKIGIVIGAVIAAAAAVYVFLM
jgi:DNA-directed RNA polymerase subunit RPC12/RpoP